VVEFIQDVEQMTFYAAERRPLDEVDDPDRIAHGSLRRAGQGCEHFL
jgi:hypothetical protein